MKNIEHRPTDGIELRFVKGRPTLTGYAAVFNKRSLDLGGFVEIVQPGAFKRSLERGDIRAFDSHDGAKILGRTSAGTLKLEEDATGLRAEIQPPDTQVGRDLVENVRLGNITGMSIGFRIPNRDAVEWNFDVAPAIRTVKEAELIEVSAVALPAFPDTSIALRAMKRALAKRDASDTTSAAETLLAGLRAWANSEAEATSDESALAEVALAALEDLDPEAAGEIELMLEESRALKTPKLDALRAKLEGLR